VADALRSAGARVEIHRDHFEERTPDAEWLAKAGQLGWVVLTKDKRIRCRPLELAAIRDGRARVFALTSGNLRGPQMAEILARHLPRMMDLAVRHLPPFVGYVSRAAVRVEGLG